MVVEVGNFYVKVEVRKALSIEENTEVLDSIKNKEISIDN